MPYPASYSPGRVSDQEPVGAASAVQNMPWLIRRLRPAVLFDPSDLSTLFQDRTGAAATRPAAIGDPVGTLRDKSGNGYHATAPSDAARPLLQADERGVPYLLTDNTDDKLVLVGTTAALKWMHQEIGSYWAAIRWNWNGSEEKSHFIISNNAISSGNIGFVIAITHNVSLSILRRLRIEISRGVLNSQSVISYNPVGGSDTSNLVLNNLAPFNENALIEYQTDPKNAAAVARAALRINSNEPVRWNAVSNDVSANNSTFDTTLFARSPDQAESANLRFYGLMALRGRPAEPLIAAVRNFYARKLGVSV